MISTRYLKTNVSIEFLDGVIRFDAKLELRISFLMCASSGCVLKMEGDFSRRTNYAIQNFEFW